MKKLFLLSALCLLLFPKTYASHFAGGELRYEYNGTSYDVYLYLYRACQSGTTAPLTNSAVIQFTSVSASQNFSITAPLLAFDTVNIQCPGFQSSCINSTSSLPGYITGIYKTAVTLPSAATDWVMSYTSGARTVTANIGSSSSGFYLEARLNNSTAINSNPLIPNTPTFYALVNSHLTIPMQTLDAEGDSLVYSIVAPMVASGTNALYNIGYTATNPTGGYCYINPANKTLNVKGSTIGAFAIAVKVQEYRNGNLIGSFMREMTISILPGTGGSFTFPVATSSSVFTTYTCPGQSNSVTVSFTDSTATDSVYLTVIPPTMSGWTFSSTTTAGLAAASATITWTTPSTMNPATLPHFFIKIRARDNGCPRAVSDYAIIVRTRQCLADSVWPGDANADKTVNIYDPLAIAIANGKTGPARTAANTTWTAQACALWGTAFVTNNTDIKHADCNGDGTINSTDLAAVTANYSMTHPKGNLFGGNEPKITGAPDLYFDLSGISMTPGATVNIPVKLGNTSSAIADFYGLATNVSVTGLNFSTAPVLAPTTSWLGSASSLLNFTKPISLSSVDWSLARTDQQNMSGQGTIATLSFTVPVDAVGGTIVNLNFGMTKMIDKDGRDISSFNALNASAAVQFAENIKPYNTSLQYLSVVPNPSAANAELYFGLQRSSSIHVKITDAVGRIVWTQEAKYASGSQKLSLPANLSGGLYLIHVEGETAQDKSFIKWIKQ